MSDENANSERRLKAVNAITNIAQIDHNKVAELIKNQIEEGHVNPLDIYISIKRMEKIVKGVKDDAGVKEIVHEATERALDGGKKYSRLGADLTTAAVHTYYDFSDCNDPYYEKLKELEKTIGDAVKEREKYLKSLIPSTGKLVLSKPTVVIEEVPELIMEPSGETATLNPPVKKQRMGTKVTFRKQQE